MDPEQFTQLIELLETIDTTLGFAGVAISFCLLSIAFGVNYHD